MRTLNSRALPPPLPTSTHTHTPIRITPLTPSPSPAIYFPLLLISEEARHRKLKRCEEEEGWKEGRQEGERVSEGVSHEVDGQLRAT